MSATENIDSLRQVLQKPRSDRVVHLFEFEPFDYQADLLDLAESQEIIKSAVKPGRQVGKTITGGAIAADCSVSGSDVMILGPFEDTVSEMMEEARNHLLTAEEKLSKAGITLGTTTRNKYEWEFSNGGRLRARTVGTDGTQIRGKNPDVVLIDEAAYIKSSVFTEVIEPFFSTHDSYEFYLFSTPAGKSGYFYEKVAHDDSFHSPHWPSRISPLIDDSFLQDKREELDSQTFAQEYLGEFADAGNSYLPHEIVDPCIDPDAHKQQAIPRYLGVDPAEKGTDRLVILDMDTKGVLHNIWSKETVTGPDFVGLLTELHTSDTVPQPDWGTGKPPVHGYDEIVVESNMAGLATDIAQAGIGDVITPVKSTRKSKGPMYKRLKRDLEAEELTLPNYRRLITETTALEYSYTANSHLKLEHPPNGHDDHPDALMLANAGRVGLAQQFEAQSPDKQAQKVSPTFSW